MRNGKSRVTPGHFIGFTIGFIVTDYLWYRMRSEYINSVIWKRVLGENNGTPVKPVGSQ
jgi:hypothetical protein